MTSIIVELQVLMIIIAERYKNDKKFGTSENMYYLCSTITNNKE